MEPAAFFEWLAQRADRDSAVVATLRRSLAFESGTFAPAFPVVEPVAGRMPEWRRRLYYLAAGLWALAQRRSNGAPIELAAAMRRVNQLRDSTSVERRFAALLDSDPDELAYRLRQAVGLVSANQIAIDWPLLLADLIGWNSDMRRVQRRWARIFWSSGDVPELSTGFSGTARREQQLS